MLGEVPGERPPRHRDIDIAIGDGLDQCGGRVWLGVIPVDAEAYDVAYDSAIAERVRRRRVVVVRTDEVQPDAQPVESRVVERREVVVSVGPRHEDICGAV